MKVKYIYRPPWQGNFSFENIFDSVAETLVDQAKIEKYYCRSFFDLHSLITLPFHQADIFHITGAVNYLALTLPKKSTILTLHDVGYFENPVNQGLKKKLYKLFWLEQPLKRVKYITVVSEFTKNKLHHLFRIPLEKISVIPNPVVYDFTFAPRQIKSVPINVLQIGTGAHKNIKGLIEASKNLPVHLIMVSKLSAEEKNLLELFGISYENYFNVSKEFLVSLYKKADLLYFASFYEGFGMPIIEAQALGRPVITSNLGAMKEVAGNGAILVNPYNVEDISEAIKTVINEEINLMKLMQEGLKNASKYSLTEVARKYMNLYLKILHD